MRTVQQIPHCNSRTDERKFGKPLETYKKSSSKSWAVSGDEFWGHGDLTIWSARIRAPVPHFRMYTHNLCESCVHFEVLEFHYSQVNRNRSEARKRNPQCIPWNRSERPDRLPQLAAWILESWKTQLCRPGCRSKVRMPIFILMLWKILWSKNHRDFDIKAP